MGFILKSLFHLWVYTGVQCVSHILLMKCKFADQESFVNSEGIHDVRVIHRDVILQFGQKGDVPVNSEAVTFLLTGTELNLRLYLEEAKADQLECDLHRYSTNGLHVQWPLQETQDYNYWYSCTIRHRLFTITSFLRQPSLQPAPGKHDYHNWTVIKNGDILTTKVALIMKTKTPEVKSALGSQTKLDCQFVIDHKGANYTVEWYSLIRTQREQLFSYNSRSMLTEGTGVDVKDLLKGDASYDKPATNHVSKGTFSCSVSMNPVVASLSMGWTIEEQPKVSLTVKQVHSMEAGQFQRIVCQAENYYPQDVEMIWYRYKPTLLSHKDHAPLPDVLEMKHSSHKSNRDGTVSLYAYLDLHPSMKDSGTLFTCSVFHQSLSIPIRKNFILHVEDPVKSLFRIQIVISIIIISALLYIMYNRRSGKSRVHRCTVLSKIFTPVQTRF